jgi:signal transduction histidine kinase/ligand-binding sensor domain-containing protein
MLLSIGNRAIFPVMRTTILIGVMFFWLFSALSSFGNAADYIIDVKDTEDDLPSSTVTSIAQTPEGYLWVGTYNGLARFDGERFVTFTTGTSLEPIHARIKGLYIDVEGTLWINTFRGGLTSYRDGVFENEWKEDERLFDLNTTLVASTSNLVTFVRQFGDVLQRRKSPAGEISWRSVPPPTGLRPIFQCADSAGRLWFLTRDRKILWFENGVFSEFPENTTTFAETKINTVTTGPDGRVWIGAENYIGRWNGQRLDDVTPTNGEPVFSPSLIFPTREGALWVLSGEQQQLRKQVGRRWVTEVEEWRGKLGSAAGRAMGVHEDRNGGIWFNHYGNGLFHILPDGTYERFTTAEGLPGDRVGAWFQSHDGSIWIGVDHGGLVRLRERHFQVIGQAEGLPARTAFSVCEDQEGQVWIGTGGGGLFRLNKDGENKPAQFRVGSHVAANFVFSICPRQGGGVWLSAAEGEDFYGFRDGQIQRASWDVHGVKSLLMDRSGRVWIGTKSGLAWLSNVDRHGFTANEGVAVSAVRALAEGPDGTIWSGADDGTLYRCAPDHVEAFRASDALAGQPIWALLTDADGAVWAGTFRGGLLRFKNGKFARLSIKQGLPTDVISQVLEDQQGRVWFGTPQGIFNVAKSALIDCADGRINRVDCGRLDGLPTLECSDGYQPACWRGSDGRLWFTTVKGVVSVNPTELATNSIPAPVLIEELLVDGEPMTLNGGRVKIPPGRKRYEFRYTALSFEATRFRYQIEGFDPDWIEAGTKRTVQYSRLPAGNYRFRVIACDDKGVWNQKGAVFAFTVQPYFYEQRWFLVLATVLALGSVALFVKSIAAKKYRRELARLEQQHAIERDRARIAKDIHDDIGAGLTQITLLSELARREKDRTTTHLDRISDSARELTRAMDEIVWAVDPQHDTFTGLMDYISAYAEDFLRVAGIRCRMDLPTVLPEIRIDAELRYNLFLALKETLNNIVKHAHATEVWLRLEIKRDSFSLIVEDNGQGLNATGSASSIGGDRISSGSGLSNLDKRLSSVGGRCRIESRPGRGTRVEMTIQSSEMT